MQQLLFYLLASLFYSHLLVAAVGARKSSLDVAFLVKQFDLDRTQRSIRLETPKVLPDADGYAHFMCEDDQIVSNIMRVSSFPTQYI